MTLDEFKTLDPQRAITVRFGMMDTEEGSVDWQDHYSDVRLFISEDYKTGEWLITPLSLDGRPMGFNLDGHDEPEESRGIFASGTTPHVMQVRCFLEPRALVDIAEGCLEGVYASVEDGMEAEFMFYEDLSKAGKIFVQAVGAFLIEPRNEDIIRSLCTLMD